jgi:hypothetical protein
LMHEPPGRIGPEIRTALDALGPDRGRCTLGLLVDGAVDRRSAAIRLTVDPAALTRQIVTVMRLQWLEDLDAERPHHQWTIASYRWADIRRELKKSPVGADTSRPHPLTDEWSKRGVELRGPGWRDQLEQLTRAIRPLPPFGAAFLGSPAVLPGVVSRLGIGNDAGSRLDNALLAVGLPNKWPVQRLRTLLPRGL